jgi:hypothetical protein
MSEVGVTLMTGLVSGLTIMLLSSMWKRRYEQAPAEWESVLKDVARAVWFAAVPVLAVVVFGPPEDVIGGVLFAWVVLSSGCGVYLALREAWRGYEAIEHAGHMAGDRGGPR